MVVGRAEFILVVVVVLSTVVGSWMVGSRDWGCLVVIGAEIGTVVTAVALVGAVALVMDVVASWNVPPVWIWLEKHIKFYIYLHTF